MSNISEVLYTEISEDVYSTNKAGEYYFHFNMLGVDPIFSESYMDYEQEHTRVRNKAIKDAMKEIGEDLHPKMNTLIFGISAIKNKPIVVVEI